MNKTENQISKSKALASKLVYAMLTVLKENNRELPRLKVFEEIEKRVQLDSWATEKYEKTGYTRWRSILHFYSIDCIKAGFLVKKKGIWYLTPEGEEALKLGDFELLRKAKDAYKEWRHQNPTSNTEPDPEEIETEVIETEEANEEINIEEAQQEALEGIKRFINAKNPYEFQDLVAALLRGMGYYTPFVAPRGKDGGVDIVAYRDPLGTVSPRIKLQIKHRESTANVQEVRQLMGLMQKDGDVGIFVSTGGFTSDAKATARSSHVHVELIDLDRFIGLWLDFYDKQTDEDKKLLPLTPIYFVAPAQ